MKNIDFEALFGASPNPYVLLDTSFVIVGMNDAYLQATMRKRADLVGQNMFEAFPSEPGSASHQQLRGSLERVVREQVRDYLPLIRYDIPLANGQGFEERYWSATHTPLFDEAGQLASILQHTVDVTELHRLRNLARGSLSQSGLPALIETDVLRRAEAVQETNQALQEEQQRLRGLFEQAPGFIAVLSGPQHIFTMANAAYQQLVGRRDILGKPVSEALPEVTGQGFIDLLDRVYESGQPFVGRSFHVALQRTPETIPEERQVDFVYQPIVGANGATSGIFVQGHDVTEQRQAENALRSESRNLEILNETGAAIAAELDLDKLVQTVVDAGVELTGAQFGAFFYNVVNEEGESYTLYALAGAPREAFSNYPMPRNTHVFGPTFNGEGVVRSDDITKDPRYGQNAPYKGMPEGHLPVRSYLAVPVISRSGEVIGGLFFGHEGIGVFSDRAERLMSGLAGQAAIGIDNARLFQAAQRLNRTLEAKVEERTAERDRLWALSEDLLVTADYEGGLLRISPSWARLLGYEEPLLLREPHAKLIHPEDRAAVMEQLQTMRASGRSVSFEDRLKAADGSWRWIAWTFVPDPGGECLHGVGRDVTEQKERAEALAAAEEALRQAQKMETVGQLTGGVAHDFNNLLQIVTGNLDILIRSLPDDSPRLRRSAENAMTGAKRAVTLTQRLLAFSRRQPLAPKPTDLNKLVAGMSELLHRTLGETIEVETVFSPGLWRVEVDPNQLENALLNLAINARDAMPDGGKLTIETSNTHLDRDYVAQHAEVVPGQYAVICVTDTGVGMGPETATRAFEPFFTTKEVGKGTGLGLSMVYGFVKQSGGHVKVYSEPEEGTTVKVYLPRLLGTTNDEEMASPIIVPEGTRDETILVCEDDDDVRAYSVEVLRELGYRVLEAHDGPSALRLLERQESRVDLLFTDVVLPSGMSGALLAEKACALRPELKVLFTTGYARNAIVHHGRLDPGVELIGKPFTYADLAGRVRDMLDS